MKAGKILIGWSTRDVTPYGRKVSLRGQFHVRITEEVRDPLFVTALALEPAEASGQQAMIVSLDTATVTDYITEGCRETLKKELPGFNPDMLFISATHTHTAPDQPGTLLGSAPDLGGDVMTKQEYGDFLIEKISEAVIEAWKNRKPGALSWGKGYAVIGHNRRVSYFDGSTKMYGKTEVPEFSHIEGYEDHGVDMLFTYDSAQKLTGMVVNVPCPSQCSENEYAVSSDYWHEIREKIHEKYGNDIFILPQCAAAGDQSPRTMVNREADIRMLELKGYGKDYNNARRRDIADKIAAAVDEVLPLAAKDIRPEVELEHEVINLDLVRRKATEEDYQIAKKEVDSWQAKLDELKDADPTSLKYSRALRRIGFNQCVADLYEDQQNGKNLTLPVELHVLRIGDIAMCTNRFEYYLDYGMRIKGRSQAIQTFVVQLAGSGTYLPTERGMQGGSYGAYIASTPIGPGGGQQIVEKQVETINGMFAG